MGSVLDLPLVHEAVAGVDAVIHVAAIPNPRDRPPEIVFDINSRGTWNVMHAAAEAGVPKVVLISSECATGLCYQKRERPPAYLPVDARHPMTPTDPYSLSKQVAETIGASFARRGGMSVTVLRPTFILFPQQYDQVEARRDLWHYDLWSYVDPRDVAEATSAALAYAAPFEIFFVSAADTLSPVPTLELVERRFGHMPRLTDPTLYERSPWAPIYDIGPTASALGVVPRHRWRDLLATSPG
jgi:nucleoside-diphosphate-sugar epimerase